MDNHLVNEGDILVVASDGVFDNLSSFQIGEIIEDNYHLGVQGMADAISEAAFRLGADETYNSPFAKKAKLANKNFMGGKLDDTTCVVAKIRIPPLEPMEAAEPVEIIETDL